MGGGSPTTSRARSAKALRAPSIAPSRLLLGAGSLVSIALCLQNSRPSRALSESKVHALTYATKQHAAWASVFGQMVWRTMLTSYMRSFLVMQMTQPPPRQHCAASPAPVPLVMVHHRHLRSEMAMLAPPRAAAPPRVEAPPRAAAFPRAGNCRRPCAHMWTGRSPSAGRMRNAQL